MRLMKCKDLFFLHGSTALVDLGHLYEVPGHTHVHTPHDNDMSWPTSLLSVIRVRYRKEIGEKKE